MYFWAFALWLLSWSSVKICLPALPTLAQVFSVPEDALKLSVSLYLAFFALSQPIWGSLSERFGRRPVLLSAIAITAVGSLILVFAHSIDQCVLLYE